MHRLFKKCGLAKLLLATSVVGGLVTRFAGMAPKPMSSGIVSLNGVHIGQTEVEVRRVRRINLSSGLTTPDVKYDNESRVCWLFGDGILETPNGQVYVWNCYPEAEPHSQGFPCLAFEESVRAIGLPNRSERMGKTTCWTFSKWSLKLRFSDNHASAEIGGHDVSGGCK